MTCRWDSALSMTDRDGARLAWVLGRRVDAGTTLPLPGQPARHVDRPSWCRDPPRPASADTRAEVAAQLVAIPGQSTTGEP